MLIRVLDGIRNEAAGAKQTKQFATGNHDDEAVWQARSRAYVHLYLKVMFGLRDFTNRDAYVTDGAYDGGIDGYFIDTERKQLILLQSKLRRSEEGFEGTPITVKELLAMQIRRVLSGEKDDECGEPYNGRIQGLQRRFSEILDQGKYRVRVVILANVDRSYTARDLERLSEGYETEVCDFTKAYKELLLPVLAGNLFQAGEISISLDLSNKGAGSKITYSASVPNFDCDITVVFVPIAEIARIMSEYRNSILKYNPRSYLDIVGDGVNNAVRDTVLRSSGNDFALLNNGITLICDESAVSEQSGRKHKAQFYLLNPQIINGGQTAYTLSLIYDETPDAERAERFGGQEVLVKAIALTPQADRADSQVDSRRALIDRISTATNSQTAVSFADRISGEDRRLEAQAAVYERLGVLLELKRGEFGEGIRAGYIDAEDVLERTLFQRLYYVANGQFTDCLRRRIIRDAYPPDIATNQQALDRFHYAFQLWRRLAPPRRAPNGRGLSEILPRVYAGLVVADATGDHTKVPAAQAAKIVAENWAAYLAHCGQDHKTYGQWVMTAAGRQKRAKHRKDNSVEGVEDQLRRYFKMVPRAA